MKPSQSRRDANQTLSPRLDWFVLLTVTGIAVLVELPFFMVGTLSVGIRSELGFSTLALGGLVSILAGLTVALAVPAARLVEQIGYARALVVAPLIVGLAMLGPAILGHNWWHMAFAQAVAAAGAAMATPAIQLALATRIPSERQGIAFGLNLASVPAGILLAGLAVPAVGETVGWRWAFGSAGVLGFIVSAGASALVGTESAGRSSELRHPPIQRRLVLLGAGALFLGVWGTQTVTTFAVEAGVREGQSPGSIGWALGVASTVSIVVRIVAGWRADRVGPVRAYRRMVQVVLTGVVGIVLLAIGSSFIVIAVGVVMSIGFGWGWNAVLQYGLIRSNPRAAASTSSFMMIGAFSGSALGPVVFGYIASGSGFRSAWLVSAIALSGAGLLVGLASLDPRLSEIT